MACFETLTFSVIATIQLTFAKRIYEIKNEHLF